MRADKKVGRTGTVCFVCAVWIGHVLFARVTPATLPSGPAGERLPIEKSVVWHETLKEAYAEASKEKRPILVVLGAEWCGPCKALEKEMGRPEIAKSLSRWTLVHLDTDNSDEAAPLLQSGAIPCLRVLGPSGRRVDVREGAMKGEALVEWLDGKFEEASAAAADELLGTGAPAAADLPKLVKLLADPDAAVSEAAIKRLAPYPAGGAGAVVQAFAKGNLATRLACLELLSGWKAPVAELDPWRPESVTTERVKALLDWSVKAASTQNGAGSTSRPASKPTALTPAELQEARQQVARMIAAPNDEDARAGRERLARLGRALMPEVLAQLRDAPTDAARERLLALRYRLAAPDALVLAWPGGIERLAAGSAASRRKAAEELVGLATADHGPLLLELFADADPLVREISLRGLRAAGKGDAARALLQLLADPDLNVRAAVLKELAQSTSPAMLNAVIEFAKKEPDADLVVHAARVLRESKSPRAFDGLLGLLSHANWRVRAEAAEGLNEIAGARGNMTARQGDLYAAMIRLLDDPDGFVVSRATIALGAADMALAVEPMAKAAERHPELGGEIIRSLAQGENKRRAAERFLRQFCTNKDEGVRSQAIAALVTVTGDVEREMKALLKDDAVGVRMWAAASFFTLVNSWRPNEDGVRVRRTGGFLGFGGREVREKIDPYVWAAEFRSGKERPKWMTDLVPDLEAMTRSPGAEMRVDAALALLPLGPPERPLEVIRAAVAGEHRLAVKASGALPWLAVDPRVELFQLIAPLASGQRDVAAVVRQMAVVPDPKAADAIWALLDAPAADVGLAEVAYEALSQMYYGDRYNRSNATAAVRTKVTEAAKARAAAPNAEMRRLVALAMLLGASLDDAAEAGQRAYADASAPAALRVDGLQTKLLAGRRADGIKAAVAALSDADTAVRAVALRFLSGGADEIRAFRGEMYVNYDNPELNAHEYVSQQQPPNLAPPPGVPADAVRKMLKSAGDDEDAARAGYLLALMGEPDGIDAVVRAWRARPKNYATRRLAYRAIAALKDEKYVPVLADIYASMDDEQYYLREFYWTIRGMTGEPAMALRKRIRDKVGMDQLR